MNPSIINYAAIAILGIIFAVQILNRQFLATRVRYFFWSVAIIMFTLLAYQSCAQYFSWLTAGPPASFLLPPASPITYFLFYILNRIWLPYLLSLAFAGIAYLCAKYLNKKYNERFFYPEEYYFIALGFFLCVHPFWIGFLVIAALSYLGYGLITAIMRGGQSRASFYYLWLPAALIVNFAIPWLLSLPYLTVLKL